MAFPSATWEREKKSMKQGKSDDLRPEYRREDLGPGVRGKYLEAYRSVPTTVILRQRSDQRIS